MILLVDDDAVFLTMVGQVLKQHAGTLFASTAADALGLVKSIDFSIALVDLDLPDQSGFELIRDLRVACPALPIIAMSAVFSDATLESALEFGACRVLNKPATADWAVAVDQLQREFPQT